VEQPADRLLTEDLRQSNALRARARRLYLRAHSYGLRGLDAAHKGFGAALEKDPQSALAVTRRRDVPLLYWTAASHGLAIASSKDDPEMIAQLPVVEAIIRRVLDLDESWNGGAAHEFFISIENSRVGVKPSEIQERMKTHFERALTLSKGTRATLFVSYAEAASVATQNRAEFQSLLERALAIDPGAHPEMRLATLVAQHRARWLFSRADELFLEAPATPPAEGQ
jgi:predicted anti-sigma-YlaC factor YlaD